MRRREFIAALASATVWPLHNTSPNNRGCLSIGFLSSRSPNEAAGFVGAFRQGLADNGFYGRSRTFCARLFDGQKGSTIGYRNLAADLVRRQG